MEVSMQEVEMEEAQTPTDRDQYTENLREKFDKAQKKDEKEENQNRSKTN